MFTLPTKVQLQVFIADNMVDVVDVVIPGGHVKTLTSASRLIQEYDFSKRNHYISERKKRGIDLSKPEDEMTSDEKAAAKRELPKLDNIDCDGSIFVKAEWEGYGDQLPPAKSETLVQLNQAERNRNYYTKQEQFQMLQDQRPIDVNDPRNELIIKHMRTMKNDYLDRLLSLDSKFLLNDVNSFRHMLLRARKSDPNYTHIPVPQLNSELINPDISKYYIDWLEQVYRQETFKAYIAQKE
jgi:hypothetical protein